MKMVEPSGKGAKPRKGNPGGGDRYFPDDDSGMLYFTGTQSEWENEILPTIKKIDNSSKIGTTGSKIVELQFADAEAVIEVTDLGLTVANIEEATMEFTIDGEYSSSDPVLLP